MDKKSLPILIIFFVVSIGLLSGASYMLTESIHFTTRAQRTEAVIIDIITRRDSDGVTYSPQVSYTVHDEKFIHTAPFSTSFSTYEIGETTTILYNPENPHDGRLDGVASLYMPSIIVGSMGAVFFLISAIPLYLIRRRKQTIAELQMQGHRILATVTRIEKNHLYKVNGKSPWRIFAVARNPITNTDTTFRSENLWENPALHMQIGTSVTVYVDPQKATRHYMDTSFLPKQ